MKTNKHDFDSKQRFGIRKLSVGVCSVLLSTLFLTINENHVAHADTTTDANAAGDKVEDVAHADQAKNQVDHAKTVQLGTNAANTTNNSDAAAKKTATPRRNAKKAAVKIAKSSKRVKRAAARTKKSKTRTLRSRKLRLKKNSHVVVSEYRDQKAAANNLKPIAYGDGAGDVAINYQLTDADAARFLKNSAELEKAGAKITWESKPAIGTAEEAIGGGSGSGNVLVTYKDGTTSTVPVSFTYDYPASVKQMDNGFYYVKHVGDVVTSMDTPDANGHVLLSLLMVNPPTIV